MPRNEYAEGRRYLDEVLAMDHGPTSARAKALTGAAHLARDGGDPAAGRQPPEEAIALQEGLGDRKGLGRAMLAPEHRSPTKATLGGLCRCSKKRIGSPPRWVTTSTPSSPTGWEHGCYELGDRATARTMHGVLVLAQELGWRDLEGSILGALSEYAIDDGRYADAVSLAMAGIRISLEDGQQYGMAVDG